MMYARYIGEFRDVKNNLWEVKIMQESESSFPNIGILSFPYETPLEIEWLSTSKEEVVCGSIATLTLLSPNDRTYEDLYSIEVGKIRLEVYKNTMLYWSGILDTEFYEEPYSMMQDYEVSFTFSDFGILDRLKFDLSGILSLEEIINYTLSRSKIIYNTLNNEFITTSIPSLVNSELLKDLSIRADNFYDEDGEANTLYEVIEGILQPLALRIIQKNGIIYIYDLNGAYHSLPQQEIYWVSDDQCMGVDKIVNNAKINLSTYSNAVLMSGEIDFPGGNLTDYENLLNTPTVQLPVGYKYYVFNVDLSEDNIIDNSWDRDFTSFAIHTQKYYLPNNELEYTSFPYFHIQTVLGGEESNGIAYSFCDGMLLSTGKFERIGEDPSTKKKTLLMKTKRILIPAMEYNDAEKHYLRISLDLLIDARYNPFTQANDGNEESNYNNLKIHFGYLMIPLTITLYDADGNALQYYSNEEIAKSNNLPGRLYYKTKGSWLSGEAPYGSCWFEWYDPEDRSESSGVLGWKKNRHNIGLTTNTMFKSFAQMEDGQYIPYPHKGGYLEICVYTGIWPYDFGEKDWDNPNRVNQKNLYDKIRWMLYKTPKVEIVKTNITKEQAEIDDIEYNGYINEYAKEDLEIDTICGTLATTCSAAKCSYLLKSTNLQVKTLSRAGRTTQAEQLLIGTLYSQFSSRKIKLSGTASLLDCFTVLTDAMQNNRKFIILSEVQNIRSCENEITAVELRPDEYESYNDN